MEEYSFYLNRENFNQSYFVHPEKGKMYIKDILKNGTRAITSLTYDYAQDLIVLDLIYVGKHIFDPKLKSCLDNKKDSYYGINMLECFLIEILG